MDYLERVSDPQTKLCLTGGLSDWVPPGGNGHGPFTVCARSFPRVTSSSRQRFGRHLIGSSMSV